MDGKGAGLVRGWALPSLSRPAALALLATFVGAGLVQSLALSWALIRENSPMPHFLPVFNQLTGGLSTWLTLPVLLFVIVNAPSPRIGWGRFALAHVLGYLAFNVVEISLLWGLRWLGRGLFGLPVDWNDPTPSHALQSYAGHYVDEVGQLGQLDVAVEAGAWS